MKKLAILITLGMIAIFTSCKTQKTMGEEKKLNFGHSERDGMLIGQINEADLQRENYKTWYDENYDGYNVDTELVNEFKEGLKDFKIQVYMGTWCGDSHRETPAFIKILKEAGFPEDQLWIFALNRSKKTDFGIEEDKKITHVPTFIFYKKGKEVARIVESPVQTLEEDIKDIVDGNPQTPHYTK